MNIKKDFGMRVRELRTKKGITQLQLAEICGIDPKHMSHIETGRSFPKSDLIERFAGALDVDYTEFFKVEHFQDRKILLSKIQDKLSKTSDCELQNLYKVICACIN